MKEIVYISLGSNKGNRILNLRNAVSSIASFSSILSCSPIYETPPWGFNSDQSFLNAVISISTDLEPELLLSELLSVERQFGRIRGSKVEGYSDRIIDLDILIYGNRVINKGNLQVPHPRMNQRKFVLEPLCSIAPKLVHPTDSRTISEIFESSKDESEIDKTDLKLC